jgi:hypothetical protein
MKRRSWFARQPSIGFGHKAPRHANHMNGIHDAGLAYPIGSSQDRELGMRGELKLLMYSNVGELEGMELHSPKTSAPKYTARSPSCSSMRRS